MQKSVTGKTRCCGYSRAKSVTKHTTLSALNKKWIWKSFSVKTTSSQSDLQKQSTQRKSFDDLGKKIGIKTLDDWYHNFSNQVISQRGGNDGLQHAKLLKNTSVTALMAAYPEHDWHPWKFKHQNVPQGYWGDISNQRKFFNDLGKKIGIQTLDDWYAKITLDLVHQNHGASILEKYDGSAAEALMNIYSEHSWIPWKFTHSVRGSWQSAETRKKYFDWLGNQLGVKQLDDWYPLINTKVLIDNYGASLIEMFHSPTKALMDTYPDHNWIPWKFTITPAKFWHSMENQKSFMEWLGRKVGVKEPDDWYPLLNVKLIEDHCGPSFLKCYNGSPIEALKAVYPQHNWMPWRFNLANHGFWKSTYNQRQYMDWLADELGVKEPEDWYPLLDTRLVKQYGGSRLVAIYNGSVVEMMKTVYPEHEWIPWRFKGIPMGFWKDPANQRKFFDWLGNKLDIRHLDDWYDLLSAKLVRDNGGLSLIGLYVSVTEALMAVYPEHNWVPWKFPTASRGFWESKDNITQFIADLSEKLSIQTLEDWYRVDFAQLQQFGAARMLPKNQGLYHVLKQQYPDYPWDIKRFFQKGRKGQRWLVVTLKKMFPNEEILEDYMHPKTFSPSTKRPMQLDVYIPSKSLAFEYQGIQHYRDVGMFGPSKQYQLRDQEKRVLCASNNIKLIEVPYWWNRTEKELQQLLQSN